MVQTETAKALSSIASGEHPVLETLAKMTVDTQQLSSLDKRSYFLVRIAGLAAMDAPPISYLVNAAAASDVLSPDDLRGLLVALAPIIGSARTTDAAGNMLRAFATAMHMEAEAREAETKQKELVGAR
jgi:hypothetical protein